MIEIKRLGVLSVAKMNAAITLVLGLIGGILWLGMVALAGFAGAMGGAPAAGLMMGGISGIFVFVFLVILYAVVGFIVGAIIALLYNLAAGWFGGIEVELSQ